MVDVHLLEAVATTHAQFKIANRNIENGIVLLASALTVFVVVHGQRAFDIRIEQTGAKVVRVLINDSAQQPDRFVILSVIFVKNREVHHRIDVGRGFGHTLLVKRHRLFVVAMDVENVRESEHCLAVIGVGFKGESVGSHRIGPRVATFAEITFKVVLLDPLFIVAWRNTAQLLCGGFQFV